MFFGFDPYSLSPGWLSLKNKISKISQPIIGRKLNSI
jgi:hypothetical protein